MPASPGLLERYRESRSEEDAIRRLEPELEGLAGTGFAWSGLLEAGSGWVASYVHEPTGMTFALVPGGRATVRSVEERWDGKEWSYYGGEPPGFRFVDGQPVEVEVRSFLVATTPVTQAVWRRAMETAPWQGRRVVNMDAPVSMWTQNLGSLSHFLGAEAPDGPDLPAIDVSHDEALEFAGRFGLALPTEVQWEVACRAGAATRFPWGDAMEEDRAWCHCPAGSTPQPVGQRPANGFGLHDMIGNVWEWTADWYGERYPNGRSDPVGPAEGEYRSIRGGGIFSPPDRCAAGFRVSNSLAGSVYATRSIERAADLGFRVVASLGG